MPRPVCDFHGFIGQQSRIKQFRVQLEGGKSRGQPLRLVLLVGPSGIGKTTLAEAAALHVGAPMICGSANDSPEAMARKLMAAEEGSVLFIDEAHNLSVAAQELLYQVVDRCRLPAWACREVGAASVAPQASCEDADQWLPTRPISILLATDQPGELLRALLKRVELRVHLRLYTAQEMRAIIAGMEPELKLTLSPQARTLIASVCGGLPRQARYLLGQMQRQFGAYTGAIDMVRARRFLKDNGIDRLGLGRTERAYLKQLGRLGHASLETLAQHLGLDPYYVRAHIEAPLVHHSLIMIGTGGRQLSDRGKTWVRPKRRERREKAVVIAQP